MCVCVHFYKMVISSTLQFVIIKLRIITLYFTVYNKGGRLRGLTGSALDHRSLPPEFESRCGHIWKVLVSSLTSLHYLWTRVPPWSSGSVLDHRSLPPVFESQCGHIWRLFRLSLHLITFGGPSAHLAYLLHKSGHKMLVIIITIKRRQFL